MHIGLLGFHGHRKIVPVPLMLTPGQSEGKPSAFPTTAREPKSQGAAGPNKENEKMEKKGRNKEQTQVSNDSNLWVAYPVTEV